MRKVELTFPQLIFVASTHLPLGAGIALLLSDRLRSRRRKVIGTALTAVGVITAVPRLMIIMKNREPRPDALHAV